MVLTEDDKRLDADIQAQLDAAGVPHDAELILTSWRAECPDAVVVGTEVPVDFVGFETAYGGKKE